MSFKQARDMGSEEGPPPPLAAFCLLIPLVISLRSNNKNGHSCLVFHEAASEMVHRSRLHSIRTNLDFLLLFCKIGRRVIAYLKIGRVNIGLTLFPLLFCRRGQANIGQTLFPLSWTELKS